MCDRDIALRLWRPAGHVTVCVPSFVAKTSVASVGLHDFNLHDFKRVLAGGFGNRGVEGKILAANYARTQKKPFLGICLGMQVRTGMARRTGRSAHLSAACHAVHGSLSPLCSCPAECHLRGLYLR